MNRTIKAGILIGAAAAVAAASYFLGVRRAHQQMEAPSTAAQAEGSKPLYWYDPMYPQHKFDKPGKSPFMDMQLVPKYAGEAEAGTVSISPRVVQNLGVRTAEAKSGSLEQRFEAVGSVAYNERGVIQLQARSSGFVERLHARAPLDPVAKGAPLVDILYPEWAAAQEELLLLRRQGLGDLAAAARRRLALLGMSEAEIAAMEREGRIHSRVTLRSPVSGVIAELGVREGMTVMPGSLLFKLVDLSSVWVNAEVPEVQAAVVRPGSEVEARVPAYPDAVFKGTVGALLPEVNPATRTLRARIELANPGTRLKPGMYATLSFRGRPSTEAVLVPSEAVIRTGQRDVIIVALGEGKFRAVEVQVGMESGGQTEVRKGLKPGDKVALSGQFLIDSEASLSGALSRLEGSGDKAEPSGLHKGRGKVTHVDAAKGRIEIDHDPMPSMKWPRMEMGFIVEDKVQLGKLKKGDTVEFEMHAKPDADGNYVIPKISGKP
jgi:Cu(I)/Ag(I) efflux system membrane fusion protein